MIVNIVFSIAKSLGAKTVAKAAFEATQNHKVVSCVVSDRDAVGGIVRFLGMIIIISISLQEDLCTFC